MDDSLIGQFYGSAPSIAQIQAAINFLWGRCDKVKVLSLGNKDFIFKFENNQTKTWVLERGPWFIAQKHLLLKNWTLSYTFDKLDVSKFPIWIRLKNAPMKLFTSEGISHIASVVGTPLCLDNATENRRRIQFAMICVEVGQGEDIPDSIVVDIEEVGEITVYVEYLYKPKVCSLCGKFGNADQSCQGVKKVWNLLLSQVHPIQRMSLLQQGFKARWVM